MLGHLIRKEMLDHILGFRFLILSALAGLVIWMSLYSGYCYYAGCLRDYRAALAATEDRLRRIQEAGWNFEELQKIGFEVHKPPTPMSIFVRGLEPILGRSVFQGGSPGVPKGSPATTEPLVAIFPPLDPGMVGQVVLSLFVLLFTYDAVCGEKEAGTLRLTASYPVPRDRLLLGKLLGVLLPIYAAFGIPALLGLGVILLMPDVQLTAADLWRLGTIAGAFAVYMAVMACAGLLASCLTRRVATSFVLLLAFWVGAVILLPRLSLILADNMRPAISRHQYLIQKEKVAREQAAESRRLRWKWRDEHPDYFGGAPEARARARSAFNDYYREMEKGLTARYDPQYARLTEEFTNRYQSRQTLADALARFSPAFAVKSAAIHLAGTGVTRQQAFEESYGRFNKAYTEWNWALVVRYNKNPAPNARPRWDVSGIPRFVYQEIRSGEEAEEALADVGILALWGLIFFIAAYVAMLRYDLR